MVRAYAIACIALVLAASAPAWASHAPAFGHTSATAGWMVDRFTMTGDRLTVIIGAQATEVTGGIVHLYDGLGTALAATAYVRLGGNNPDVVIAASGAVVGTDTFEGQRRERAATVTFACDASCNPSREFILATSGAGTDLTVWGYGAFGTGITHAAHAMGPEAGALAAREFGAGVAVHAGLGSDPSASVLGVDVTQGAVHEVDAANTFAGGFLRFRDADVLSMTLETPSSTLACPCGVPAGPPGLYTYRYDHVGASGDEAFAVWADVRLT